MAIELKHLAPYMPYGLKFGLTICKDQFLCTGLELHEDGIMAHHKGGSSNVSLDRYYKPILRSMSSINRKEHISVFFLGANLDHAIQSGNTKYLPYETVEYLISQKFDVFGLIKQGLAIDINTI